MTQSFLVALQFLTRLPVRISVLPDDRTLGCSLLFYPLVGLIIGAMLGLLGWLLRDAPPLVASALLVSAWILLTGGLHLDGLADSADAWAGGMGDAEKTLMIMKDPNCGAAGATAIILIILLKFVAIHSLLIAQEWIALLCAAVLARTLLPLLFLTTPYVRGRGLGAALAMHQPYKLSMLVVTATPLLMLWFAGFNTLWLLLAAVLTFLLLRQLMIARIAGTTGDTAGAMVEISETSILLSAVLFIC